MANNVQNILVGHGKLFWAAAGTELPAFEAGTSTTLQDYFELDANWNALGFTQDGVTVSYQPQTFDVEVDQLADAARIFRSSTNITVSTTLAEATLANMLIAWGLDDAYLQETAGGEVTSFSLGVPSEQIIERTLAFVGAGAPATVSNPDYTGTPGADDDPEGDPEFITQARQRVYLCRRALSMEGSEVSLRRTEASVYPTSFRILPDGQFGDAEYGAIIDRAADDTTATPTLTDLL